MTSDWETQTHQILKLSSFQNCPINYRKRADDRSRRPPPTPPSSYTWCLIMGVSHWTQEIDQKCRNVHRSQALIPANSMVFGSPILKKPTMHHPSFRNQNPYQNHDQANNGRLWTNHAPTVLQITLKLPLKDAIFSLSARFLTSDEQTRVIFLDVINGISMDGGSPKSSVLMGFQETSKYRRVA